MIYAYVSSEAQPSRVRDLIEEPCDRKLDVSLVQQVHAVTGRYDSAAFVESPCLQAPGS